MRGSEVPHMIAIAGPSGSGKSSLAARLAASLPGGGVVCALDAYYRDQRGVAEDAINVDEPGAIDHALLIDQISALARAAPVQQPVYDYATHARAGTTRTVHPAPYVIVEGLFALYWPEVRAAIHTPVFLSLDHEACLARRIARDERARGRTREAVVQQYERTERPMYERYVHPTRRFAQIVLDAAMPLNVLVERMLVSLRNS
jgi:uridine kinase